MKLCSTTTLIINNFLFYPFVSDKNHKIKWQENKIKTKKQTKNQIIFETNNIIPLSIKNSYKNNDKK